MIKHLCFILIASLSLAISSPTWADHSGKWGNKGKVCGEKGQGKNLLACKVFHKAEFYLAHAQLIGLSDEQVQKIRSTKTEFKKKLVQNEADVEKLKIDIMDALHQPEIDQAKINSLIDKKYDLKKGMAKDSVQTLLAIKGTLTPEQKEKAKEIWMKGKKR